MTLESGFAMIIKSREMCDKLNTRKCRNWQTSKTKDLVAIAVVWVQVPSSALICGCDKYSRNAVFIVFFCVLVCNNIVTITSFLVNFEQKRQSGACVGTPFCLSISFVIQLLV